MAKSKKYSVNTCEVKPIASEDYLAFFASIKNQDK